MLRCSLTAKAHFGSVLYVADFDFVPPPPPPPTHTHLEPGFTFIILKLCPLYRRPPLKQFLKKKCFDLHWSLEPGYGTAAAIAVLSINQSWFMQHFSIAVLSINQSWFMQHFSIAVLSINQSWFMQHFSIAVLSINQSWFMQHFSIAVLSINQSWFMQHFSVSRQGYGCQCSWFQRGLKYVDASSCTPALCGHRRAHTGGWLGETSLAAPGARTHFSLAPGFSHQGLEPTSVLRQAFHTRGSNWRESCAWLFTPGARTHISLAPGFSHQGLEPASVLRLAFHIRGSNPQQSSTWLFSQTLY